MHCATGHGRATTELIELPDTYWIHVAPPALGSEASRAIRTACLRALERTVPHVVVDLTGVEHVCVDGLDLLQAAGEALAAKQARLWLANTRVDGLVMLPFVAGSLGGLAGLSDALDGVLSIAEETDLRPPREERREP